MARHRRPVDAAAAGTAFAKVQPALAHAAAASAEDASLTALADQAGLSPFHLHRLFAAVAGETPKQYALRVRVSRGAALLLATGDSVLDIALACGFQSHEAFTRAFRRQFGVTPRAYRARGFNGSGRPADPAVHASLVSGIAPCVRLFHMPLQPQPPRTQMAYDIVRKDLQAQPVLVVRRRVTRAEIGKTIGESLPHIFQYAQQHGIALAGHPFTRYLEVGAGLITIEPGMRVTSARPGGPATAPDGDGGVIEDVLPAGPAATTIHSGPYETLSDGYAALERWMEAEGLTAAGAPWEIYVTDPAAHPDPKDWKTEIFWPLKPRE